MRIIAAVTAIGAAIIWLIVAGYSFINLNKFIRGGRSEIFELVTIIFALIGLATVFVAMINRLQAAKSGDEKVMPDKLLLQGHTLIKGNKDEKLSLLQKTAKRYGPGRKIPKPLRDYVMTCVDLEKDETVRLSATDLLLRASNLNSGFPYVVDVEIVNYLRLRLFEEPSAAIRKNIFETIGELHTRHDSPVGSINWEIGQAIVASLTLAFQRETDEEARVAAFSALTRLWCLDLEVSETVVRDAMNDTNQDIRDSAEFAVQYAFSDD